MRILFANHTAAWSGAEVSLMRLVHTLRPDHDVAVACPPRGPLADAVDRAGVLRLRLPPVDVSLRLHPVRTPAGVAQIAAGGVALALAAKRFHADVVHANTPRAGLMGAMARRLGGPPFIVRAHEHVPLTPVGRAVRGVLLRSASAVVAVSDYTARRFDEGLPHPCATRVYNSIDHSRFHPDHAEPAALREELRIPSDAALLGQVAQITPWKGQDTAIRALAALRREGVDAHLVLVGGIAFAGKAVRYDNHGYLRGLERLAQELGVREHVHFLGQRDDVPQILRALDLTLLPSWAEPFGLATVESMALGTPPLVSDVGAGQEIVEDGVSGRLLPPRRPEVWAAAAAELLRNRDALERLARGGPPAAARFSDDVHAREMLTVYERAAAPPPSPAAAVPGQLRSRRADNVVKAAPWPP
jgi:glycosyltransferase involved in cell wall biosynthesis